MVSPLLAAPDKFEVKCSEQAITAPTAHLDLHLLISAQTFQVLLGIVPLSPTGECISTGASITASATFGHSA